MENFPALEVLNLSFNQVATLTRFDRMQTNQTSSLSVLDLSYNSLITMSTHVLDHFPALKTLNLSSNQMTSLSHSGEIEANHTSLRFLDLSNNSFTSIPVDELVKFHALEIVDLSFNKLSIVDSTGTANDSIQIRKLNVRLNLINDIMLFIDSAEISRRSYKTFFLC